MAYFNTIQLGFETRMEQYFYEKNCGLKVWEHDIMELWSEFDISGCEPSDLAKIFEKVSDDWCENEAAYENSIEAKFLEVGKADGILEIMDDEGYFLDGIYEEYAQEVADRFYEGNIDELEEECELTNCFRPEEVCYEFDA